MTKSEREPAKRTYETKPTFCFWDGTRRKPDKKGKNAKEADIAEATTRRGRFAERGADDYEQVIKRKGEHVCLDIYPFHFYQELPY